MSNRPYSTLPGFSLLERFAKPPTGIQPGAFLEAGRRLWHEVADMATAAALADCWGERKCCLDPSGR